MNSQEILFLFVFNVAAGMGNFCEPRIISVHVQIRGWVKIL